MWYKSLYILKMKLKNACALSFQDAISLKERGRVRSAMKALLGVLESSQFHSNEDIALATYELGLLFMQTGHSVQGDILLSSLGFAYRLPDHVFSSKLLATIEERTTMGVNNIRKIEAKGNTTRSATNTNITPPCVVAFDSVLPLELWTKLRVAFGSHSIFWKEHGYPTNKFFSYNIPIEECMRRRESGLIEKMVSYLLPLVEKYFCCADEAVDSVEWWAHCRDRDSCSGHQLHFDTDEIALSDCRHDCVALPNSVFPLASSVLYLDDDGMEGEMPTVVTNQTLQAGDVASQAWCCSSVPNRLLLFDSRLLHGVVPQLNSRRETGRRITLMIGWWRKGVHVSSSAFGPNMTMPSHRNDNSGKQTYKCPYLQKQVKWPDLLYSCGEQASCIGDSRHLAPSQCLIPLPAPIWKSIEGTSPCSRLTESTALLREEDLEFVDMSELSQLRRGKTKRQRTVPAAVREATSESRLDSGNVVFVGKWFVKSLSEIRDDILTGT